MKVKFFKSINTMEIFFKLGVPNIGVEGGHDAITKFVSKRDRSIVGYLIEGFDESLNLLALELNLTISQRIAVMSVYARTKLELTQESVAKSAGIATSSYKRLEEGENISLDTLEKVLRVFSDFNFSACFSVKKVG